jgi:hypothetical protein
MMMLQDFFENPLRISPLLLALALPVAFTGCGGGDTKIVERDPIPIEDDHDHDNTTQGRLLVAIKDLPKVGIWDIADAALLEEYTLTEPASGIYPSPDYRYGFIIQRTANLVNVIDSGLSQEDHGDHKDDIIEAPRWLAFGTDKVRPTHFTTTDTQSVIFYDGNVDTTTPAEVGVFTEADIRNNTSGNRLEYTTHMHGAAQARGDYLLSTIRDPLTTSTLPDAIGLYKASNGIYSEQQIFAEPCPGVHGSAQNETQIAFGCTDGVLVITQTGDSFSAKKIMNPASFTGNTRIGTLYGDEHIAGFVGIASGQFFVIDTTAESITPINWIDTGTTPTALAYGFADEGSLFVILDNQGWLHSLNTNNWTISTRIQAITSNLNALPAGSRFELALTPGHKIYVSDPIANQIKQIDLDDAKVSGSLQLNGTPGKIAWVGIEDPAGNDHH